MSARWWNFLDATTKRLRFASYPSPSILLTLLIVNNWRDESVNQCMNKLRKHWIDPCEGFYLPIHCFLISLQSFQLVLVRKWVPCDQGVKTKTRAVDNDLALRWNYLKFILIQAKKNQIPPVMDRFVHGRGCAQGNCREKYKRSAEMDWTELLLNRGEVKWDIN